MFLSREIDLKLCQNYTKMHIYQIVYKNCSIKQLIFNKYTNNRKRLYPTAEPENLKFSPFAFFYFFLFCIFNRYN